MRIVRFDAQMCLSTGKAGRSYDVAMTDPEEQITAAIDGILENIARLKDDSHYLSRDGRNASAFVLAAIALEEVGKIIRERWDAMGLKSTRHDRTAHLQKQWAVACLLVVESIYDDLKREALAGEPDVEAVARKFVEAKSSQFLASVMEKRLDRAKQLGLYWDSENAEAGRSPKHLTREGVEYLHGQMVAALALMHNRH